MHILHIAPLPSNANGINVVVEKLSCFQRKLGNDVTVWRALKSGVTVFPFIGDFNDVENEIDSIRPDIVVFHSLYHWDYIRIGRYLNRHGIPYIIQLHGALSRQNYRKSHLKKFIANVLFFKRFVKKASSIVYLNEMEHQDSVIPKWNPNHIIIPNGCEIHISDTAEKSDEELFKFLFIGRIDINHKGLDLLTDALRILKHTDAVEKFLFEFYGVGNEANVTKLRSLLSGLEDIAQFKGAIYGEEKLRALHSADVFVHTSRYEGMPMAVLEALACGLPCLLTPGTNMADSVASAGCGWVAEATPESIAATILKIVNSVSFDKELLRQNALNLARKFSWEKIAEDSILSYAAIVGNSK